MCLIDQREQISFVGINSGLQLTERKESHSFELFDWSCPGRPTAVRTTPGLCGRQGLSHSIIACNLYLKLISVCAAWLGAKGSKPIWYTACVPFRFPAIWIRMWKRTIPSHFSPVSIFSFEAVMTWFFFFLPAAQPVLCFHWAQHIIEKRCGTKGKKGKLTDVQKKDVSTAQPFAVFFMFLLFMIMLRGTPCRHESPCSVSHSSRPGRYLLNTDKTAWDGKSTWINIYYGRCCFRQTLFRGNLLCIHRCYGNNLLIELFSKRFLLQSSK